MTHALILGGAGFIGLHLAQRLVADGVQVTVVDDFSRGRDDHTLDTLRSQVDIIAADLTDRAAYDRLPVDADQIYLLAAIVGVRNVERSPQRVLTVNAGIAQYTGAWVPEGTRLFFGSTSEVYAAGVDAGIVAVPTAEDVPIVVTEALRPRSAYAISKLFGEALLTHQARDRGFELVIGRFHNIYGPRMGFDHVVPELIARADRREDPFVVYGPEQTRAFCYVDDAVEAVLRLMAEDAATGKTVHIGVDDAETSIDDLTRVVLELMNHTPRLETRAAPAGSVARRCPDTALLKKLTGFSAKVPLAEGLARTVSAYAAGRR